MAHLETIVIVNKFMKEVFIKNIESEGKIDKAYFSGKNLIISDGYHTFDELYDHRLTLFITLCQFLVNYNKLIDEGKYVAYKRIPWRSKLHADGSEYKGWFVMGINKEPGMQVTYHLPLERWKDTDFVETLDKAPEFDGHSHKDVLERLKIL